MNSVVVRVLSPGRQPLDVVVTAPLDLGREGDGLLLADDRVSRRHARLEVAGDGELRIVDLESSNGVFVDGSRIDGFVTVPVGSVAVIGDTRIEVLTAMHDQPSQSTLIASDRGSTAIERLAHEVSEIRAPGLVDVADEPGTLTIAFSDIEGSTELTLAVGDVRWMEIMNDHTALMSRHVDAHQGRIVRSLGDGFMMCFRSARQAVLATIDMQRELDMLAKQDEESAVRVRLGLHTGEVLQDDEGDLFGRHVQIAAQIGDLATGGQILVSGLAKQITEPRGDFTFGQEIRVHLAGLEVAQSMHSVQWRES